MYLIDTNVISETRKKTRANAGVLSFFRQARDNNDPLYLSIVTISELQRGVDLVRFRGDTKQAARLDAWLATIVQDHARHVLTVDAEIAQLWGRLRVPQPDHAFDKLIAATALIHDLTVVTRNVGDFARTGVKLLNPFD
ncbi:type II toxin-antitoxin system VapC family toxin [Burkholderia cenocepacia]